MRFQEKRLYPSRPHLQALGRVAQWESARFTRERSQVRNPPRPWRTQIWSRRLDSDRRESLERQSAAPLDRPQGQAEGAGDLGLAELCDVAELHDLALAGW